MDDARAIVFGAQGLIGQYMMRRFAGSWSAVGADRRSGDRHDSREVDFTDHAEVSRLVDDVRPSVVVNAVNLAGGVDFCEQHKIEAKRYHFDAVVNLAQCCARNRATLVFISTDYVFDGKEGPYSEDAEPDPLNTYGLLKLMAEEYIQRNLDRHLIVRTTNVYGYDPDSETPNFVTAMLRRIRGGEAIRAPVDQYGNPTLVDNLVDAIFDLLEQQRSGRYNIAGSDWVNRYEWVRVIAEVFELDQSKIGPMETENLSQIASRPLRSGFVLDKARQDLRIDLVGLKDGLRAVKKSYAGS